MNDIRVRRPRKLQKSVSGGVLAEAGRFSPVGPVSITMNMQPLSRVDMTLAEGDLDLAMHDLVEFYNQNGSVGIYRVTKVSNTYRKERKIELSHGLDVFSDSMFDGKEEYKGTVAGMLQKIVAAQTQTIGGVAYWQLGTCEDTNIWNKDINRDNLMECLTDIAKKEEDFVFTYDQSTFPWTLNFVRRDDTVLSEFRLNRNTSICEISFDDSDLCTRLFLSVTEERDEEGGAGTYIEEGYHTFDDTGAQQVWGVICKSAGVDQQDFASWADLEEWVHAYFTRHNNPALQITIDGIELVKLTNEVIDEMHLSRMCRVSLPEYNAIFNERVISVNYPDALRNPMAVKVTLANKRLTAEDAFQEISSTATSAAKSARAGGRGAHNDATYFRKTIGDTANGLYARIEMTAYYIRSEVYDTANGLYSRIEQTASSIRTEVSNTAASLRSEISQTASEIRTTVSNTAASLRSSISQTASQIRSEVVGKDEVISCINQTAERITIQASRIDLTGYVTASQLSAATARIDNLINGTTTATLISTQGIKLYGYSLYRGTITVNGTTYNVIRWGSGD